MRLSLVIYRLITIIAIVSYYVYDGYVCGCFQGISQTYYIALRDCCYYIGMPCLFYEMGTMVLTNSKKTFLIIGQALILYGLFCLLSYFSFGEISHTIVLHSLLLIGSLLFVIFGIFLKKAILKGQMSHWLAFPISLIFIFILISITFDLDKTYPKQINIAWMFPSFICGLFYLNYGLKDKDKRHIVQSEMAAVTFVVLISELLLFNQYDVTNELIVVKKTIISITGMLFSHFLFVDLQMSENSVDPRISRVFPPIATIITSFIICDSFLKRQEIVNLGSTYPILFPIIFIIFVIGLSVSIIYLLLIARDYFVFDIIKYKIFNK